MNRGSEKLAFRMETCYDIIVVMDMSADADVTRVFLYEQRIETGESQKWNVKQGII